MIYALVNCVEELADTSMNKARWIIWVVGVFIKYLFISSPQDFQLVPLKV